ADIDGDGFITINELNVMIRRNGLTEEPLPPLVVRRIHQIADTNHDGQLDYNEFVGMINNPTFSHIFGRYVTKYVNFVIPRKRLGGAPGDVPDIALYEDEYTCCPPKLGMIIISIIELIFFMIDEFHEENSTKFASGPMAQTFIYDPAKRYEIWRFLTYMFVHIGYLHLTVNLTVQIFIGIPLEMVHGWWRVLLIYFTGVVAGSLCTSITDPTSKLAGASGGVYSLITAHIATIILNWKEMSFPAVQLIIFLLITGVDVGTSIYNRYCANMDEHIGYVAHFAGAVAGLLVGISVLRNLEVTWKENVIWWFAAIVFSVLMLI
ncbi:rhomboid-related protein 2, partial [Asbolus verrucosus]